MTTAVYSPSSVSSYANASSYDTAWTTPTTVTLAPGHGGYIRYFVVGAALDAVHDGCTITDIKVEFTASQSVGLCDTFAYASFAGIAASKRPLTSSSVNYSATGGSGTLPSVVRGATLASSAMNFDSFYDTVVNISTPIVTITYTDNGIPYMLQFSL